MKLKTLYRSLSLASVKGSQNLRGTSTCSQMSCRRAGLGIRSPCSRCATADLLVRQDAATASCVSCLRSLWTGGVMRGFRVGLAFAATWNSVGFDLELGRCAGQAGSCYG